MMKPPPSGLLRRIRRDQDGVTAVEFAMIGPVLALFVIGVGELGLMVGAQAMLDNALFVGSRTGKTGYQETNKTQEQTIADALKDNTLGYIDKNRIVLTKKAYSDFGKVGEPEPFVDANNNGKRDSSESYSDVNGNGSYDTDQGKSGAGRSSEIVVYTATYDWTLFTPMVGKLIGKNGVVPLKAEVVVKNEPY